MGQDVVFIAFMLLRLITAGVRYIKKLVENN